MSRWWLVLLLLPSLLGGAVEATLKCNIPSTTTTTKVSTTVFGSVDFEFWYAVGLNESTILDDIRIFELEQLLYTTIDENVLWCAGNGEQRVDEEPLPMEGEDTEGDGWASRTRRRSLQADEASSIVEEVGGEIGPVLFTPGRKDEVTDSTCPPRYITIAIVHANRAFVPRELYQ
jgi:hypothetical protein